MHRRRIYEDDWVQGAEYDEETAAAENGDVSDANPEEEEENILDAGAKPDALDQGDNSIE